ncbi:MSHA biogenesis protein MshI [Stutzerimonas azotifigens]|uniref:MSHA biogenesis protein MshI n=1 Tax=Stutzerimonas azotifigens TaxID=291995 RepID=UPI0003FDCDCD|nr:MSHA biogenesis protein MshI [Stutzerimonas azotifigens]
MKNVNLYQPERPSRRGPRPRQLLAALAAVVLLMSLHAAWSGWRLADAGRAAERAEQQARAAEAELGAVSGLAMPQADPTLPAQLAEQETTNRHIERLAAYLATLDAQRGIGFAPTLAGLAERHPPSGLWLTRIRLADGGERLGLQGLAERQTLLPAYLQSLGLSAALAGRTFGQFDVQREGDGLLRFTLSSRKEQENGDE